MTETHTETTGFDAPPLRRLRYFHGQMVSAQDFQREQEYFREKLKLRMRCLLGYGVVCGLHVHPAGPGDEDEPEAKTDPTNPNDPVPVKRYKAKIKITPGLAVDCDGNELVVRGGCVINLGAALPEDERDKKTVWVGIEYCERKVEPTRAVYNDGCADDTECEYGWTEESYAVRVTGCEPPKDERCDTCCSRCEHKIVWLARIDDVDLFEQVREDQIHMNIRRPFGKYVPTVITGINWRHGYTYTVDEAKALLGTQDENGGLVVRLSDDIRVDSLQPGVVEIQVIEGGSGRNASTWYMGGSFEEPGGADHEFTQRFRYRQTTREVLQDGDRVLITVRAAFILDRCCRPVDGTHVGGKVPMIEPATGESVLTDYGCKLPPSGVGPWTSGTGAGGDVFESWFFVKER
jgi:hypothetical protein